MFSENASHWRAIGGALLRLQLTFLGGRYEAHLISAIGLAFLLTWAQPAPAQDLSSQLVGAWKFIRQSTKEVATGKISHPYGETPTSHAVYTKGGHVAFGRDV